MPEINAYSGPIYGAIGKGVQAECRRRGWKLDVAMGGMAVAADFLGTPRADGIIAIVGRVPFEPLGEVIQHLPVVLVNSRDHGVGCDSVDLDNRSGVRAMVELLEKEGHKKIVFLYDHAGGRADIRHHLADRIEAFLGALVRFGLDFTVDDILNAASFGPSRQAQAYDGVVRELLDREQRPTAVLAFNDAVAAQFIHATHRAGLSVPGDFAVTGYDNHAVANETAPAITTFSHNRESMGSLAVRTIAHRLEQPLLGRTSILVSGEVVLRESHASCAADPAV
ncbi:MAG: LacI family DNA-binding transcriptional regulator [Puniceicoccaceae bacterium]